MKTGIAVSCPYCGKENTVAMELKKEIDDFVNTFMTLTDTKSYSFSGYGECVCRRSIIVALTVTAGGEGNDEYEGRNRKTTENRGSEE